MLITYLPYRRVLWGQRLTAITLEVKSYIICIFTFIRKCVTLVTVKLYKYFTSIGEQYKIRKSTKTPARQPVNKYHWECSHSRHTYNSLRPYFDLITLSWKKQSCFLSVLYVYHNKLVGLCGWTNANSLSTSILVGFTWDKKINAHLRWITVTVSEKSCIHNNGVLPT